MADTEVDVDASRSQSLLPGLHRDAALRCLAHIPPRISLYVKFSMLNRTYRDLFLHHPSDLLDLRRTIGIAHHFVLLNAGGRALCLFDLQARSVNKLTSCGLNFDDPSRECALHDEERASHDEESPYNLRMGRGVHLCEIRRPYEMREEKRWRFHRAFFAGSQLMLMGFERDLAEDPGSNLPVTASVSRSHVLNLPCGKWEEARPVRDSGRFFFGHASGSNFAIIAGGCRYFKEDEFRHHKRVMYSVERYDSDTNSWQYLPPMPIARESCDVVVMDEKVYVLGGRDHYGKELSSGAEYDPSSMRWRTIQNMCPYHYLLFAVANNELYSLDTRALCLLLYQKPTNTWAPLGCLKDALKDDPVRSAAHFNMHKEGLIVAGNKLFAMAWLTLEKSRKLETAVFCWSEGSQFSSSRWDYMYSADPSINSRFCHDVLTM